jgi:hypothetical protein
MLKLFGKNVTWHFGKPPPSLPLVSFGDTVPYPPPPPQECLVLFRWPLSKRCHLLLVFYVLMILSQSQRIYIKKPGNVTVLPSPKWSNLAVSSVRQCDNRRPVSTSTRPISNFKINQKTILYIYLYSFSFLCHYSFCLYIFYSVLRGIQNHKEAILVVLNCKYFTVLHL